MDPRRDSESPDRSHTLNGVRIDPLSAAELVAKVDRLVVAGRSEVVHFLAAHPTGLARRDAGYRRTLNAGAINVADGVGVAWGLRLFGRRVERIPGADALAMLCRFGVERGLRHYLFGGSPEVVRQLHTKLERTYPRVEVAGAESPPFRPLTDREFRAAGDRMRDSRADLVWVGLGTPKQDYAAERLQAFAAAPVILCVGAAFDFVSGAKRRAPRWMQRVGLEWLHRLATEPTRLWRRYLIDNARFAVGVGSDLVSSKREK